MIHPTAAATLVAQNLWEREQIDHGSPEAVASLVERVSGYLKVGISRWIGAEGYRILLDRALLETRMRHPVLAELRCNGDNDVGTIEAARVYGTPQVEEAFVALVGLMVDRLGRVLGDEMARRLVEQSWSGAPSQSRDIRSEGVG